MKKFLLFFLSTFIIWSCGGNTSGSKASKNNANYLDRDVSTYATGASGIDQKIVLHRDTKEYQYYVRAAYYDSSEWHLDDEGHYTESYDEANKIVTCSLDNAKVKGNESLGTVHTVKINLEARTAELLFIAGRHIAKEVSD